MSEETTVAAPLGRGARMLLTFFYLGLSPVMPGTVASLATAALIWWASHAADPGAGPFVGILLVVLGVITTMKWADAARSKDGRKDPGWVVSDEVAGQALASLGAFPQAGGTQALGPALLAFVLFRVFDITKPPPIRQMERIPGAAGVLWDDVMAGLLALVITYVLNLAGVIPSF